MTKAKSPYKHLRFGDAEWEDIRGKAIKKLESDEWQHEQRMKPDPTLTGVEPDFVDDHGRKWSLIVTVEAVPHPL